MKKTSFQSMIMFLHQLNKWKKFIAISVTNISLGKTASWRSPKGKTNVYWTSQRDWETHKPAHYLVPSLWDHPEALSVSLNGRSGMGTTRLFFTSCLELPCLVYVYLVSAHLYIVYSTSNMYYIISYACFFE